ncbi:phage antirepressor [Phascolarctobacterium faecium]|uniref:phage antirepressor n=1 Tax=Phascolarctobacterium faecium TaxID=33025 RepID=UPI00204F0360|nr:MAG TPA: KilAC domain protein [Caudoviricetes sp.]
MQDLKIFENKEFGKVRTIMTDGEPLFIAADVCKALDIKNFTQAVSRLDTDERAMLNIGRQGRTNVVNEYGLYNLVLASRKPEAKAFKRWITHEVIPAIRKHGGYLTPDKTEELLNDPDLIIQLATNLKEERAARSQAEQQLAVAKPKVLFADAVAASDSTILIGDLAKIIKQNGHAVGQQRMFKWLREHGYLIKRMGADYNSPTQKAMELGLFKIKETAITHSDGHVTVSKTVKVTGKGQQYFIAKFEAKKHEILKKATASVLLLTEDEFAGGDEK